MKQQKINIIIGAIIIILCAVGFMYVLRTTQSKKIPSILPTPISTTTNEPTAVTQKTYVMTNVAQHATRTDCWVVLEEKVYDVTSFIQEHPGGERILEGCGKDATSLFQSIDDHIPGALDYLPTYFIGNLK